MTVFENIKNKNIDEFVNWLSEHCSFDYAPWWKWWDENYCKKCESETAYVEAFEKECEHAYCELNGNCRFFLDMGDIPDEKQVIKMWLESRDEEERC
ncbi:MAG: hypothetical protein J6R59_10325 [Paludibacteraceae bacterium]|nr:hypothetical protein [Paludibacteraceae bacterium]